MCFSTSSSTSPSQLWTDRVVPLGSYEYVCLVPDLILHHYAGGYLSKSYRTVIWFLPNAQLIVCIYSVCIFIVYCSSQTNFSLTEAIIFILCVLCFHYNINLIRIWRKKSICEIQLFIIWNVNIMFFSPFVVMIKLNQYTVAYIIRASVCIQKIESSSCCLQCQLNMPA